MDKTKQVNDPKYLRTREINEKLDRIEKAEKAIVDIEKRIDSLEKKIDNFLSFEKEKYKRILNDLKGD